MMIDAVSVLPLEVLATIVTLNAPFVSPAKLRWAIRCGLLRLATTRPASSTFALVIFMPFKRLTTWIVSLRRLTHALGVISNSGGATTVAVGAFAAATTGGTTGATTV